MSYFDASIESRLDDTVSGSGTTNVSIFNSYPMNINLVNVVNEDYYNNKSIDQEYVYKSTPCNFNERNVSQTFILIVVKSHVLNINLRLAIRHMWKNEREKHVRIVFTLGKYALQGEQWRVDKEFHIYKDIVQGNFPDNKEKLTYKTMMGFNWIANFCRDADVVLFLDDDYYVYTKAILEYLTKLPYKDNMFIGNVIKRQQYKSISQIKKYPKYRHYTYREIPTYVNGGAFVISKMLARKFQLAFPYVRALDIDDVYLGIVAHKLGVQPQHDAHFDTSSNLSLVYECSHYAPRLLRKECVLSGRPRDHQAAIIHVIPKADDSFWERFRMLPRILRSAAKQTLSILI